MIETPRSTAFALLLVLFASCESPQSRLPLQQFSQSEAGAFEADLESLVDGRFAVAWYDSRPSLGGAAILIRELDENLRPLGPERALSAMDRQAYEVDLATFDSNSENVVATWYQQDSQGRSEVVISLVNVASGQQQLHSVHEATECGRIPAVEAADDALLLTWLQWTCAEADERGQHKSPTLMGQWFALRDGELIAREQAHALATASATTWNLNIDVADSQAAVIAFDSLRQTQASELHLIVIDGSESQLHRISADDGIDSTYPDALFCQSSICLLWTEAGKELRFDTFPLEELGGTIVDGQAVSGGDEAIGGYMALYGDTAVLAWSERTIGSSYQINSAQVNLDSVSVSPIKPITATAADSYIPSVVAFDNGVAAAWNDVSVNRHGEAGQSRSQVMGAVIHSSN